MARYTSRNLNDNDNSLSKRKKWGIALLIISLLLLLCIVTRFIYPIRAVLLGFFGLSMYPILIALCVISVFLMQDKHYVVPKVYIWTLCCLFFAIVCLFQLIFAVPSGGFGEYLSNCYAGKNTAGGLFMGLFSYGFVSLLGVVGSYILLALLIIVCVAFIIDHFLKLNEYNEITSRIVDKNLKKANFDDGSVLQNTKPVRKKGQIKKDDELVFARKSATQDDDIYEEEIDENINADEKLDFENEKEENETEKNLAPVSKYREKLELLQSKTSAAAKNSEIAINIWGEDFINSLHRKDEKQKNNDAERKDYNINDLILNKRKEDSQNFAGNTSADRPMKFVHDDSDADELFAEKLERHNRLFEQNLPEKNNSFNSNLQSGHNTNFANQNNNTSFLNSNIQNATEQQKPIWQFDADEDEDDDINDVFENDLDKDDVSDIISPTAVNENSGVPNLNGNNFNVDNSRLSGRLNEEKLGENRINNSRISNPRFDVNSRIGSERMQGQNDMLPKKPEPKEPEQIKIRQTEPTDQPTTKYTKPSPYIKPPISLLQIESAKTSAAEEEYSEKAAKLEETLENFKIPAKVVGITHGPAVTRYELQMPAGIPVKRVSQHSDDIAMQLESLHGVRIEAPIPGRNLVGVEVPNGKIATIGLKDIISSKEFQESKAPLTFALGKDISGAIKVCDLGSMPHLLVAGSTGSGKSVCLNVILLSLLYRLGPEDLKLILIDPKRVEFVTYNFLPHMLIPKAINESQQALNALDWAIKEMTRRYDLFAEKHVRNFKEYNSLKSVYDCLDPKLPYIVIVIDEVADLMMNNKREMEEKIKRLTQLARAAGMHLILATQRPSVDVITGTIKSNLPSRIAFAVTNYMDSKTILDQGGADNLLGKGDMLYAPQDAGEPTRIQCPFVDSNEVYAITEYIKNNNQAEFDDTLCAEVLNGDKKNQEQQGDALGNNATGNEFDPLLPRALLEFIENGGEASISLIQRRYAVGYGRAARIVDQMERAGYVTPKEGNNKRSVLISKEKYDEIFGTDN